MQKPFVLNRYLSEKWKNYETDRLTMKIIDARPSKNFSSNHNLKIEKPRIKNKKETFSESN